MKTLAELQAFFESDLRPDLQVLETGRLKHRKKIRNLRIVMICLLFCPAGLIFIDEDIFSVIMFQIVYICLIIVPWAILHLRIYKSYKPPEFKNLVIARIVEFIDPSMTYDPKGRVPFSEYAESRIFLLDVSSDDGDDLVTGSIGNTRFTFSELHTWRKSTTHTDHGVSTELVAVFHGLFFYADFNKSFQSRTYVMPDHLVRRYGKVLGNYFRSRNKSHGELVKLEDPRFEKEFVVYSHDQIEARYILTPALMQRIWEYRKKSGKETYFSFVNNRIYVAIEYINDVFEANLYKSLIDFGCIQEYYEDMAHAIGIVEDLNLNTRIWN